LKELKINLSLWRSMAAKLSLQIWPLLTLNASCLQKYQKGRFLCVVGIIRKLIISIWKIMNL